MKDRNTILNDMVMQATDIMEMKIDYFLIMVEQYEFKGDPVRAAHYQNELDQTQEVVDFIRERVGCWA